MDTKELHLNTQDMKTIKLEILAKDIMESSYTDNEGCAIARAVGRLNDKKIIFSHPGIWDDGDYVDLTELDYKVRQMYAFKEMSRYKSSLQFPTVEKMYGVKESLQPTDFEYVINI